MGEFGDRLRKAREEQGLSYTDIEEKICIQDTFVRALEEERFDDLPTGPYARGLLRNYVTFLGLDAEEIVGSYRSIKGEASPDVPPVLNRPLLEDERPRLWGGIFLGAMILLVCAIVGWYAYNRFYLQRDPWPTSRQQPTESVATHTEATPTQTSPLPSPTEDEGLTEIAEDTPTATVPTVATPTPAYTPRPTPDAMPTDGIVVQADFVASTYVEVTSDGEGIFAGVLEEGEERSWTAGERIALRVGNAGGISLTVNGVQAEPLGASGEVVDVEYTLDNLPEP